MRHTYFDIISIFATVDDLHVLVGRIIYGGHKLYKLVVDAIIHLVLSEYSTQRGRVTLNADSIILN